MAAKPIPEGHERATPYLCVRGASDAIAFYAKAFGAVETSRLAGPDCRIGHAEIKIGDASLMLSDEYPEEGVRSPVTLLDPFGHRWFFATRKEDVSVAEMQRRYDAMAVQEPKK